MSKFYIRCGSLEYLTTADDARTAALWAIHQYLSRRVDLDTIDWSDPCTIERSDWVTPLLMLGENLTASQRAFGADDAGCFDTADLLTEWNQLVVAVARLESLILAAPNE